MPPHSKELFEEGAAIKSFKLIRKGVFMEQEITDLLMGIFYSFAWIFFFFFSQLNTLNRN